MYIANDVEYLKWKTTKFCGLTAIIIRTLSLLSSFKFTRFLYSKFFGFIYFKAKISNLELLRYYNIISIISIIVSSIPAIAAGGLTTYYSETIGD